MTLKNFVKSMLLMAVVGISSVSCVTNRKVAYLQDMTNNTQIELENQFEAKISPYDELLVVVSCFDNELAKPFNIYTAAQGALGGSANQNIGYLVDQYGNIQLPVLGEVHVAGLTRLQLQDKVKELLTNGGYISDPYVMVRFKDFKVFFIGADGGKVISIPNERCTFLEALAMGGDLSIYTKRDKIAVMREIDGKMTTHYLDPRSSKVFDDPFFMLQQNDFIITNASRHKHFMDSFSQWSPFFSLFSTVTGIASIYIMLKYGITL